MEAVAVNGLLSGDVMRKRRGRGSVKDEEGEGEGRRKRASRSLCCETRRPTTLHDGPLCTWVEQPEGKRLEVSTRTLS
jgi:hypothetical protein